MPIMVRSRNAGKSFELRIIHPCLKKPALTLGSQPDAERAGAQALAALDRGETPDWLLRADEKRLKTVGQAIRGFLAAGSVGATVQMLEKPDASVDFKRLSLT